MASLDIPKQYGFQFPMGIISWKGKTVYQVVSRLRRVHNTNENMKLFFLPNPVTKYYRREINNLVDLTSCQSRASHSIGHAQEIPGGILTTLSEQNASLANGIIGIVDPLFPNDKSYLGDSCQNCNNNTENCLTTSTSNDNVCFRPDVNARRRCRSAGMIPRKFIGNHNNDRAYFTDNKQYLHSRNRTVSQNEYVYIRQGDPTQKPGNALSKSNVYSASGLSHCPKYTISAALGNNILNYFWIDSLEYEVIFPDGDYDIFDLNNALTNQQLANFHFYINTTNNVKTVLLKIGYDTVYKTNTIETRSYDEMRFEGLSPAPKSAYDSADWFYRIDEYSPKTPQLKVLEVNYDGKYNELGPKGLGLKPGIYPEINDTAGVIYTSTGGLLAPSFVPLYYKPSNPQFATQGGVSSSARLLRIKYNEIQKAANQTVVLGQSIANSLAYNVPTPDYPTNLKAKIGYPMTCTPVVRPDSGMIRKCNKFIYR